MTSGQKLQPEIDVEAKIAACLILLIDGYKKSGSEIAEALGINQATVSRLKNRTQNSSVLMLHAVESLKTKVESEMEDVIGLKARELGITPEQFKLCCVGRVGHEVVEEFRDQSKPVVEEGRRGFVFHRSGAGRVESRSDSTGKTLLKKATKPK